MELLPYFKAVGGEKQFPNNFGNMIFLQVEKYDPLKISDEDVVISIFKKRDCFVTIDQFKKLKNINRKEIIKSLCLLSKSKNIDKFKLLWEIAITEDENIIDLILKNLLDSLRASAETYVNTN